MIKVYPYSKKMRKTILKLKPCAREIEELKAQGYGSIKAAVKSGLDGAIAAWYAIDDQGKACGVGGVNPHPQNEGMGIVWLLLGEDVLKNNLFTINSLTLDFLDYCFNRLGLYCVCNYVSLNNKQSVKWLKYMGFEFMEQYVTFYDRKTVFDEFYMYKEDFERCVIQQ